MCLLVWVTLDRRREAFLKLLRHQWVDRSRGHVSHGVTPLVIGCRVKGGSENRRGQGGSAACALLSRGPVDLHYTVIRHQQGEPALTAHPKLRRMGLLDICRLLQPAA